MEQPQKILVCLDLSEYSAEVLDYAVMLKKTMQCQLIALNVINKREVESLKAANYYLPDSIDIDKYVEKVQLSRKQAIKELVESTKVKGLLEMPVIVCVGQPAEEIMESIRREGADLVVMGHKGRSNIAEALFGSTAEKVFKHAKVPVLIVRS